MGTARGARTLGIGIVAALALLGAIASTATAAMEARLVADMNPGG